jgi:hypothetical protein
MGHKNQLKRKVQRSKSSFLAARSDAKNKLDLHRNKKLL